MSRNTRIAVAVAAALVVALALIAGSLVASRDGQSSSQAGPVVAGASEIAAELNGVPQRGSVLGRSDAPVTLVEYADLQCPFCAQWSRGTFPTLVDRYVQPGDLRIDLRGIAFIGPDSERALRAVDAASLQNHGWELAEILFASQGAENSGWVDDDLLRAAGRSVPGLDVERMMNELDSAAVTRMLERSTRDAQAHGIESTPSFLIGRTGGSLTRLEVTSLGPAEFEQAIKGLLKR